MKIYIATSVNARKEGMLKRKREKAADRVAELIGYIEEYYQEKEPDIKIECHSSFDIDIAPLYSNVPEPEIMGGCVQRVMECDAILMDWGYENSKGCTIEHTTALTYGKKIIHAYDLNIEPEKS